MDKACTLLTCYKLVAERALMEEFITLLDPLLDPLLNPLSDSFLKPGLLGRWDKRIVDQKSDVPSSIFLYTFYRLRALKTLYFCNFIKKKKIN